LISFCRKGDQEAFIYKSTPIKECLIFHVFVYQPSAQVASSLLMC